MTRKRSSPKAVALESPLDMDSSTDKAPYQLLSYVKEVCNYEVYLSDALDEPILYVELITALRQAGPDDTFHIYLNTPGGRMDTGLQLINAMKESAARIVTILDPHAYSMGALLFLCGDELIVPEHGMLMFHNYSSGLIGKGNEQLAEVQAASKSYERVMSRLCLPFLTKDEIQRILNGQDLWLDSEDIETRLQAMQRLEENPESQVPESVTEEVTSRQVSQKKRKSAKSS